MSQISQGAIDLIVACEVSSRAVYEKRYTHPEWPGGASGVTVGIGYDLGYATKAKVLADWTGLLPSNVIDAMAACCGVTHDAARSLTSRVKSSITVPWASAISQFDNKELPLWIGRVLKAIPGADNLPPDCLGALVSLAYNRGHGGFNAGGDRFREMKAIRHAIVSGQPQNVPAQFRAMKRLWPGVTGLQVRREKEAKLFERGLTMPASPVPAPKPIPKENPPPLVPVPKPGAGEGGAAAGPVIAGGEAARQASGSGMSPGKIAAIVIAAVVVAIIAVAVVRWYRSQPVVARQKTEPVQIGE